MEDSGERPKKRRRPALSCEQCRKRKVKCDREQPCGPCTQTKIAYCSYSSPPPTTGATLSTMYDAPVRTTNVAPYAPAPGRSQSIDQSLIRAVESAEYPTPSSSKSHEMDAFNQSMAPPSLQTAASTPGGQSTHSTHATPARSGMSDIETLRFKMKELEKKLLRPYPQRSSNSSNEGWRSEEKLRQYSGAFVKQKYCGPASWARYIEHFTELRAFSRNVTSGNPSSYNLEIFNGLHRNKTAARMCKVNRRQRPPGDEELKASVPDQATCECLMDLYLRLLNPMFQIIHLGTFREELKEYWRAPHAVSKSFLHRFLLILAIGSVFYSERDSHPAGLPALSRAWILAAEAWIMGPFDQCRVDIDYIQVYCLLLIGRDVTGVKSAYINVSTSSLLKAALQLGMHRDPTRTSQGGMRPAPQMSPLQIEVRRRLWYGILELVLLPSTEWGLPTLIAFEDFDTDPPSNFADDEYDEATSELPSPRPGDMITQSSFQALLYKTLRIRMEIIGSASGCRRLPPYDYVLQIGSRLLDACQLNKVIAQIKNMSGSSNTQEEVDFHQKYIDFLLRLPLMTLHWPFASISYEDPLFYFSRKVCLDSALVLISFRDNPYFYNLMIRGGLQFRGLMAHAGSPVFIELISHLQEDSGGLMTTRQDALWQPLRAAAGRIIDLAADRLRAGESNVKGHLFYNMAIGHIDALAQGTSIENGIYEAAKRSLQFSYEILRARLAEVTAASSSTSSAAVDKDNRIVAQTNGPIGNADVQSVVISSNNAAHMSTAMNGDSSLIVGQSNLDQQQQQNPQTWDPLKDLWTDFSLDNLPNLEAEGPWALFGWDGQGFTWPS